MTDDLINFGFVKNINDPAMGGRIQVRVPGDDLKYTDDELPWAFPLLPKMLHIMPKVGETVMVINRQLGNGRSGRYYIGPVISQPQFMYEERNENSATRVLQGSMVGPAENPEIYGKRIGVIPDNNDIAVLGRKDTDIILTDDDIRIRCGVKKTNDIDKTDFAFNGVHPAFIKMKHFSGKKTTGIKNPSDYESVINVVADKINLIGTNARDNDRYNVDNKRDLISDEEVDRFINEAHQIPYGDKLIEFLKIFIEAFQSHTHPFVGNGKTPCKDFTYKALADYNLESILSNTTRIN